jgi:hypothetical protein
MKNWKVINGHNAQENRKNKKYKNPVKNSLFIKGESVI